MPAPCSRDAVRSATHFSAISSATARIAAGGRRSRSSAMPAAGRHRAQGQSRSGDGEKRRLFQRSSAGVARMGARNAHRRAEAFSRRAAADASVKATSATCMRRRRLRSAGTTSTVRPPRSVAPTRRKSAYTFCGHVHDQVLYFEGANGQMKEFRPVAGTPIPVRGHRRWVAIVGSVGQPRDRNPAAAYTLFDSERRQLTFFRVPYDASAAADKIRRGRSARFARRRASNWASDARCRSMADRVQPGAIIDGLPRRRMHPSRRKRARSIASKRSAAADPGFPLVHESPAAGPRRIDARHRELRDGADDPADAPRSARAALRRRPAT